MERAITFKQYLQHMGHSEKTIKSYQYTVDIFLHLSPGAEKFKYKDVLDYMSEKGKHYDNIHTKTAVLSGIKKYYDYLIEIGKRNDHPCRTIYLKGGNRNRDIIHADLFTSQELELLMEREERYQALKLKNQVLISLLIYQALTAGEIAELKVQHIDMDKGTVYVKESRTLAKRHLELQPKQYRLIDRYIRESRKELISVETDKLVLGKLGTPITTDDINYIVSTFKPLFTDRNLNSKTIRQSVIANWLNEKKVPLEQVQLMAGQKWISTTAKYRQTSVEEQRTMINKFHPMG
jgi:integrase/recombinase XerD